ncbi:sigma-70 family RNA polymerase sigma factor [Mesobacillus foraminis]|uniref:RNA polymerase sigma-70 factor (ECF subfamily) n=1 Tax=Mesobacillus foraminis TaxID=279826 RepID=A0A4R2B9U0_9BACI|nr:sigma-70 family RNA polymerase sigma factor [Mesobacillus foraminis]TCN22339.1 RNA polymerase sigma-70 factor (ECF subfamily) [Mesobacillus foraminis]
MEEFFTEVIETDDKDLLIGEIMHRHGQEILQLVYSYVKNRSIAEDLTQDIFVKCYKSLHTYSGKARIRTWLWRIAINHCKDYLKSWYARNVILTEKETEPAYHQDKTVEQTVIQKGEDQELAEAVMELPIKYREVIYLFYFEELSIKEISEVTDIKENTLKTRLRRAKDLLKERLEG